MWNLFKIIFGVILIGGAFGTGQVNVVNIVAVVWSAWLIMTSVGGFAGKINADQTS
ncbi:MAG: hypothetical protein SWH61_03290 [Thermodesulfobacteriota bacterium]|nr:hypothetical protein [Thermodesulfobacteriota bacterium]